MQRQGFVGQRAPILAFLLLFCTGCGTDASESEGTADGRDDGPHRNAILISLDTLRADHLSCYGYPRPTSPNIDALAARGALFENAVAESPWTLPSHASLLSGLFPGTHGATRPSRRLKSGTQTLAQTLADSGFTTIGLTEGGYLARSYGLNQGFQIYSENRPDLATTLDSARELLTQVDGNTPYFLFLHTYDIHCPYDPPEEHVAPLRTRDEDWIETAGACGKDFNAAPLSPGQVRTLRNRYDAGIHSADALLGAFLDELDAAGDLDDTFVMITSDHGEELYEHGRIGHERTVHREVLRVPWIVVGPEIPPSRPTAPVGLTDIAPTLLDLLGVPVPPSMEGRPLGTSLRGRAPTAFEPRVSSLDWKVELYSVMTPTHQLIVDHTTDAQTLVQFDASGEERPASNTDPLLEELRSALERHLQRTPSPIGAEVDSLDQAQQDRLKALGYGE